MVTELDGIILVGSVDGNEACEVMVMTGLPLTVVVEAPAWPAREVVVVPELLVAGWLMSRVEVGTHALGSVVDDEEVASALDDGERVVCVSVSVESSVAVADESPPAEPVASDDEVAWVGLAEEDEAELASVALATELLRSYEVEVDPAPTPARVVLADAVVEADETSEVAVASASAERVALALDEALRTELAESAAESVAEAEAAEVDEDELLMTALVALPTIEAIGTDPVALATIELRPSSPTLDAVALALALVLLLLLLLLDVELKSATEASEAEAAEAEADDDADSELADTSEAELADEADEADAEAVALALSLTTELVELSCGPNKPEMTPASDCTLLLALSVDDADSADDSDGAEAGTELAAELMVPFLASAVADAAEADEADDASELASELSEADADESDAIEEDRLDEDDEVDSASSPEAETR